MNRILDSRFRGLALIAVSLALTACGGGDSGGESRAGAGAGSTTTPIGSPGAPPTTSAAATTSGVWIGSIASTKTGQTSSVAAFTGPDGHTVWMTTDGRVWSGQVPMTGDHFDATFSGHMYDGIHFPDGTNHGPASMMIDQHSASTMSGRYTGNGDVGTFNMSLNPMWDRAASLGALAGVYTRSTSNGYTMTMTVSANGQLIASDSRGCLVNGTIGVPDATHNRYSMDAIVTSCGSLDGTYSGAGALLDADAMQDWMTAMHPLEHGGHSHGGSMMRGHNTVPTGQRNLLMFSLVNDHNAIMDALAR